MLHQLTSKSGAARVLAGRHLSGRVACGRGVSTVTVAATRVLRLRAAAAAAANANTAKIASQPQPRPLSTIASRADPQPPAGSKAPRYGIGPAEANNSQIPTEQVLRVKCQCGSVGIEGRGASAINFTCHCSVCRKASGLPALPAAAFKPENIVWVNEKGIRKELPPGSRNTRFYCNSCNAYIGEDATRPLGVIALPLHRAHGAISDQYKPNHHIFYADRVADAPPDDVAPKWVTLPEGQLVAPGAAPTNTVQPQPGARTPQLHSGPQWDAKHGWYRKDIQPLSPTRGPESKVYHFTESDPSPNHVSLITPEKVKERTAKKYLPSPGAFVAPRKLQRDVIIIGGGHNGLVSAAYLAAKGLDVLVLERRHTVGGAAVTEELYPGFKFSRASYLAGLLRTHIINDLNLPKYGFKYLPRDPSSFTPTKLNSQWGGKYLMLGDDPKKNADSIAQFSQKDAEAFPKYEHFLGQVREMIGPILDGPPPDPFAGKSAERMRSLRQIAALGRAAWRNRDAVVPFYELFTAPASHILDRWFESDVLKTTLATDAVIGASCSPKHLGSAYVLLHHVMGEAAGKKGVWSYVQGGMGAISQSIAAAAKERGAEIVTNATVSNILYRDNPGKGPASVRGVRMADGTEILANTVLSNATPYHTFLELMPGLARDSGFAAERSPLPFDFARHIRYADYSCGALKINCAVDRLPEFACLKNNADGSAGPQHRGTVHFETRMEEIENAQREAAMGIPATRPVVEMTIPSSLDRTIAPPGKHVVQFFVQFAPYDLDPKAGNWADPHFTNAFADRVFRIVEEHIPNFSASVLYRDVLTPLDLERVFGMHRGNIMHSSLALHQLAYARPAFGYHRHRTPVTGLYLCGAGAHPGGGVMGAPGHNCAQVVLSDLNKA